MSALQSWDPASYARNAWFVSDLGSAVVELLAPRPGERILDLGCGDGALTKKLVDLGCEVVAVDSSAPQVEAARKLGLDAHVIDAEALPFREEFDLSEDDTNRNHSSSSNSASAAGSTSCSPATQT